MSDTAPVYNEQWYSESELAMLEAAAAFVKPLIGAIIEIGCWEGRSAADHREYASMLPRSLDCRRTPGPAA